MKKIRRKRRTEQRSSYTSYTSYTAYNIASKYTNCPVSSGNSVHT